MNVQIALFLVVLIVTHVIEIKAGLTLNKHCGDITCQTHSYCSPTDHICRPCEVVCDTSNNNHDQNRCETDCQDYLHDIRYLKPTDSSGLEMQIESELWTLKLLLGVTIGMTTTLMILSVIILLKLQLKRKNKQKAKCLELPAVIYSNKFEKSNPNPASAAVILGPENNNRGMTPLGTNRFRREPSESTLPEYSSYDNPALTPSPTHHV